VWGLQAAGSGVVRITSRLYHLASGQWIGSAIDLYLPDTMQALGSAITYVRRYSVVGLLALVAEDNDDGSAASGQLIRRRAVVASTNGPAPEADVITDTGTPEASEPPPRGDAHGYRPAVWRPGDQRPQTGSARHARGQGGAPGA
jgi:hypothetical protein